MQIWQRTVQSAGAVSIIWLGATGFEELHFERLSPFRSAAASSREPGPRSTHLIRFAPPSALSLLDAIIRADDHPHDGIILLSARVSAHAGDP